MLAGVDMEALQRDVMEVVEVGSMVESYSSSPNSNKCLPILLKHTPNAKTLLLPALLYDRNTSKLPRTNL